MSFVAASSTSEKLRQSEFEYHLRIYRDADKQEVHELFENAMVWHAHSPIRPFLKVVAKSPVAKTLYFIFALGILIWPSYPSLGMTLCVMATGAFLLQMGLIFNLILKMTRKNLHDDLGDIRGHYKLVSDSNHGAADGDLTPSGPQAFWVVEARHKASGKRELAGCGGIDVVQKDDKCDTELRRMVVSGQHLRRGIAARIVQAAIVHAKSHHLPSIYLSTSSVQEAAIHLYKRFGWVEEKRRHMSAFGATGQVVCMRLHLLEKSQNAEM